MPGAFCAKEQSQAGGEGGAEEGKQADLGNCWLDPQVPILLLEFGLTYLPTYLPTNQPTSQPTNLPTYQPTQQPTNLPT
jgi:hypothetical protein